MVERWVGVDFGASRVGLALSDEAGRLALPHATVAADAAVDAIVQLCAEHDAAVVIGWPLELSGKEGRATQRVARFIEALEQAAADAALTVAIHRRDERLTTGLAEALLSEASVYGKRRKGAVDQLAATQILQGYLDERRHGEED